MMKGFFDMVPKEIDEAAKVDGCSWFYIFARMALPLPKRSCRHRGILRRQFLE
jgi:multiple sugar transport system permease protein